MKHSFFQAVVVSILLYGCTIWTLTKRLKKKLGGNYTRMLRAMDRVIVNDPGDWGSIPDLIIPKILKKCYLMPPGLTLSIIRYGTRIKWSSPGNGVSSSLTPRFHVVFLQNNNHQAVKKKYSQKTVGIFLGIFTCDCECGCVHMLVWVIVVY